MLPSKLQEKINARKANHAFRTLKHQNNLIDFSSNDYLGLSKSEVVFDMAHQYLVYQNIKQNGATGSRLLSGNHKLYDTVEGYLAKFHNSEGVLIFNSGYTANIGFFSSVPQRDDIILYDELIHASIRDGIAMSHAKAYKFKHNDTKVLEDLLYRHSKSSPKDTLTIYVVTESVFSMDGDSPNLKQFAKICNKHNAKLIVDEAHAVGVFGAKGEGLVAHLGLEDSVFARIITFGKAMGCHGAAVLGSKALKDYLINFCRSFIYTTGLPPHALATIKSSYDVLEQTSDVKLQNNHKNQLHSIIKYFKSQLKFCNLQHVFIDSDSAIQCCVISGNHGVKGISEQLQNKGYDVKPIMSPTVPKGKERLRFCLHSYNTEDEIKEVLRLLVNFIEP